MNLRKRAFDLMKSWCDALLRYQIHGLGEALDGAILCPVCHVVHGRIADLVYPLTTIYAQTGEARYLTAAEELVDWTEKNLRRPNGSYHNDATNTWKGTTVFSALAIGETLYHFGDRLPPELKNKWTGIFFRLTDSTAMCIDNLHPHINYYAGAAANLALAECLGGGAICHENAEQLSRFCMAHFDKEGLLFGECRPLEACTNRGCHGIDMGYNMEESLPLLLKYAVYAHDETAFAFYKSRYADHMMFLMPDGGIDNSFGTRFNKWTYWGSRTSDGTADALAQLCDEPVYARALDKVITLYERCTHDDLLAGGPMAHYAHEPSCLHHSFCHAKALAEVCNTKCTIADGSNALLPSERETGIHLYQNGTLCRIFVSDWLATFNASNQITIDGSDNGGASLTLLWHKDYGPICAATLYEYHPAEPLNMQYLRNSDDVPCMTPHVEFAGRNTVLDRRATLTAKFNTVLAEGLGWSARYEFDKNQLAILAQCNVGGRFCMPIICKPGDARRVDARTIAFGDRLHVEANTPIKADFSKKVYNQVGGFLYQPLIMDIKDKLQIIIKIND